MIMVHNNPKNKPQANGAIRVMASGFALSTYLAIIALFIFRVQWFLQVVNSVARGGDTTDFEVKHEFNLWGGYEIVTGDPSIFCYILVTLALLLLVLYGRKGLSGQERTILLAIRIMFFYSVAMIFMQVVFLNLLTPPSLRNVYKFNTCLMHFSRDAPEGESISCVDDPHYVTLALSLIALLSLIDKNILGSAMKLFKGVRLPKN